ncbi:BMP family lipoprotein [Eggerthia catenaformis]
MKKVLASAVVLSMVLVGCGSKSNKAELAMITDSGDINDKSFNQAAWEAVKEYGTKNKLSYKYYKPASFDTAGYKSQIKSAVSNGAKVVVLPGFKFAAAIGKIQEDSAYKDVKFILIDHQPKTEDGKLIEPKENVFSANYKEYQPGYLAGYAAVKDGYTKLGFMGGIALPAVINYGYGYLQGANDAAKELKTKIEVKYWYSGTFNESPDIATKAKGWYKAGTEVIFSCGGQICNSIFSAATETKKKVIGVDSDQKQQSDTVITSAMKNVKGTVTKQLELIYSNKFKGGVNLLDAKGGFVGLPDDFSRFKKFTKADYEKIYNDVKDDKVKIISSNDVDKKAKGSPNAEQLKKVLTNTTVAYEK